MNRDYVSIKVDREERPDVDRIYMTFVQATTGSGGWPMSVWLTPELKPFFGGTYFPPENRWGHPGFGSILTQIAQAWASDREKIDESARNVVEQLKKHVEVEPNRAGPPFDAATLESAFSIFRRTFDSRLGGFGGAPKFPARLRASLPAALLRAHQKPRSARHGIAYPARDGPRRHERSTRRRLPSLLRGRPLVRPALREDALRPGPDRHLLPGGLPGHRRPPVCRYRPLHLRLRLARHDRCRRRLLLRGRCR